MATAPGGRHEFKVLLEGAELDPDVVQRMNLAIQQAFLNELAGHDLGGHVAIKQMANIGKGGANGIWGRVISQQEAQQLGLRTPAEFQQ